MPSTNKTPNIGLNQWDGTDLLKRDDLNKDNKRIDEKITEIIKKTSDIKIPIKASDIGAVKQEDFEILQKKVTSDLADMSIQLENKVDTSKTDIYLYLDTINGNDTNTGLASNISLKSFSKAIKILRKYDSFTPKKIIIVNDVINNVLTTWSIIGIDNLSIEGTGSKKLLKNTCIVLTSCTNVTIYNLKLAYTKALLCNGLYLTNLTFYSGTNVEALGPNGVAVYASISATGSKITLNSITIESDLNITDKIPKTLFGGSYTEIFVVSDLMGKADYGFYLFNYDTIIYKQANLAISFIPNISMIIKNIGGVFV